MPSAATLLALLPRTECTACGHAGCAPFAAALARGEAHAEDCAPGGPWTREALRRALGEHGGPTREEMLTPLPALRVARVDSATCIGCAKCLPACPVDAILGAPRQLHVVITSACTGCGLCIPPCPVDCIALEPAAGPQLDDDAVAEIRAAEAQDCTACGACVPVCPEGLHPEAMLLALQTLAVPDTIAGELARCTACSACDVACPSHIPLAAWFRHGHALRAAVADGESAADRAADHAARRQRREARGPRAAIPRLPALETPDARAEVLAALERQRKPRSRPGAEPS